MKKLLSILIAALIGAASLCGAQDFTKATMISGGVERTYFLHLPDNLSADAPLVFVLHGYGHNITPKDHGMNAVADREGFAVCYPIGTICPGRDKNCWNVGYPFQAAMEVDDVAFLRELADRLHDTLGVSRRNTFCVGMSNGGEMCYMLAYVAADRFAAVAPIAGLTMEWIYSRYDAAAPVPLFEVHGTADRISEWNGDLDNKGGWGAYVSVPLAVGRWVAANRCVREGTEALPLKKPDSHNVVAHRYTGGIGGNEVWLYEVVGGGHSWATDDMDTCEEVWKFFARHLHRE